jgi:hypothetical protein
MEAASAEFAANMTDCESTNGKSQGEAPGSTSVPLLLDSAHRSVSCQPVTVGIPFPQGALRDLGSLQLLDPGARAASVQAQKLATWPDGSVKWLLVDFIAGPLAKGRDSWILCCGTPPLLGVTAPALHIVDTDEKITIDTGAAQFHLSRTRVSPFIRVVSNGNDIIDRNRTNVLFVDDKEHSIEPRVDKVSMEVRGPVRATVCYEGVFPSRSPVRFVARYCFFAGTGLVRMRLMIHNPNRARHRGGLWDLGDPNSILFKDLSVEFGFSGVGEPQTAWTNEVGQSTQFEPSSLEIYQDSSGGDNWQSKNHVNRDGRVPCSFRGYRVHTSGREEFGLRASPTVALHGDKSCLAAAIPEFWQQFPKAIQVHGRQLRLQLFPGQFGDYYELQGGEQKTHTIWLDFHAKGSIAGATLDWVHQPVRVHAPAQWYATCGAFPFFEPAEEELEERLETILSGAIQGERSLFARREWIDEYGWRNYGEIYADHENTYFKGSPPVISHYNNQYDVVYGALLQYFRTGDARWFDLLDPLARHVIDIDIYHTDQDRAVYNGGLFWHTDHYRDAATCTHRSYSRANCASTGGGYGGGPGNEHNYTTGLLHYYYVTGDPAAREAVLSLADWVVNMDDGSKTFFRLIDDGPAGWASFTDRFTYHGPGRGAGNSINALLDGWLLSSQRSYLEYAEALLRRCVHPEDNVATRDLLNVEERWSYTLFFLVVVRYLALKEEAPELDAMYAYARASLLRYATWMVDHEQPYFDQAEKLEFPTETWAAQELRKANVLRLAARYAQEPLRARLLERGAEFAERAWSDLLRFPSQDSARAIAILLSAGMQDEYLRHKPLRGVPLLSQAYGFSRPENFVPQKLRVMTQLKSVRGLTRALACLTGLGKSKNGIQ